jgi:hypothetical protein
MNPGLVAFYSIPGVFLQSLQRERLSGGLQMQSLDNKGTETRQGDALVVQATRKVHNGVYEAAIQ